MNNELIFYGSPVAKPRMTKADKWKKRPVVEKYWRFKDAISKEAKKQVFKLGRAYSVTFTIELPKSMSLKQKKLRIGQPHMLRPDLDNLLKALNDCLMDEDSSIHYIVCKKVWGIDGKIIVKNLPENLDF